MNIFAKVFFLLLMVPSHWTCSDKRQKYILNSKQVYHNYKKHHAYNLTLFRHFSAFSQLYLDKCPSNQTKYDVTEYIEFLPDRKLLFGTHTFEIKKILDRKQIAHIVNFCLVNIKGIDPNVRLYFLKQSKIMLSIYFSTFDIYTESGQEAKEYECNLASSNYTDNMFKNVIIIMLNKSKFNQRICPLMFSASRLYMVHIADISNSFMSKNRLGFVELDESTEKIMQINSLFILYLQMDYENLTRENLNRNVFRRIQEVSIRGILDDIQSDLFHTFPYMKNLHLYLSNLRQLFHRGNKWMTSLNSRIKVDPKNETQIANAILKKDFMRLFLSYNTQFVSFDQVYEYPDEDLCLFKNYPHHHAVFPILKPGRVVKCTCTIKWLRLYAHLYSSAIKETTEYSLNLPTIIHRVNLAYAFCDESFNISACEFEQRFQKCDLSIFQTNTGFRLDNDISVYYFIRYLQYILLTILQPLLCALGIINNSCTILIIRNKNKAKNFTDPMYSHIVLNAAFNIVYCGILMLKLVNTCITFNSSLFCSSLYQTYSSQYFKIVIGHFLGNVFRLCSNFSYLFYAFTRFVLISMYKEKNFFKKILSINLRVYTLVILALSSVISIFKLFQYKINFDWNPITEFPYELRDANYCQKEVNKSRCHLFNALKLINIFLNDALCVFLNVSLDVFLFRNYNLQLKKKAHMHTLSSQQHDVNFKENIKKKKQSFNRMLILSAIVYIISHVPETVSSLLLIVFAKRISDFCFSLHSCDLINEEASVFSLFSIVGQLYVFVNFDLNINKSFHDIKRRLIKRLRNDKNNAN